MPQPIHELSYNDFDLETDLPYETAPLISQAEQQIVIGLQNTIRDYETELAELSERILNRLASGAVVKPGAHRAEFSAAIVRRRRETGALRRRGREIQPHHP